MSFLSSKFEIMLTKSFEEINSNITNVNSGGCGIFAKHLYNTLKLKGFNPELTILVRDWHVMLASERIISNSFGDLLKCDWRHVMVKLTMNDKVVYIDSYGFFNNIEEHPMFGYLETVDLPYKGLEVMLASRHKHQWNRAFDRKNSKKIKNTLVKHLVV